MVTEAGQSVLLEFIRGEYHRLTVEADPDFQPSPDHAIDQAIARLEEQVERLRSLKGSGPEIATVMGKVQEVFGERGVIWLVRPNRVLQATPLDLIKRVSRIGSSGFSYRLSTGSIHERGDVDCGRQS